jgi:hypothetical protein
MRKIALLIVAGTLIGCASTRQERAAEFQQQLPQLVAACNEWIHVDPRLDGPTIRRDRLKACDRLAAERSLGLTEPATARAYVSYKSNAWQSRIGLDNGRGPYSQPSPNR